MENIQAERQQHLLEGASAGKTSEWEADVCHGARPINTYRIPQIPQGQVKPQVQHSAAVTATIRNQMMLMETSKQHAAFLWDEIRNTVPGMVNMYCGVVSQVRNTSMVYSKDDVFDSH